MPGSLGNATPMDGRGKQAMHKHGVRRTLTVKETHDRLRTRAAKTMILLYRCLRVALPLKKVGNRYRYQKREKVERSKWGVEVEA